MQCPCGNFFTPSYYSTAPAKDDLYCAHCKESSIPNSYVNSKEWVGEGNTGSYEE